MAVKKKASFEEGMQKLEKIVSELERGETSLDKSMLLFDEGTKLAAVLAEQLDSAEQKLTLILQSKEKKDATEEKPLVLGEE